ncbi:hypothetical protein SPRG_17429 [Saprolegnia parasitica CBS 223.65]|uniref:EF-hand domain-containing protein n=1 Tax=Saprolegnia parasitica (strain CBS 223.65) TaxID=695850 RepID=A0A067BF73_SAPPC|nr:hypothetical protein SPRG_17429 [Saprolegnia parasitica CBS 223.65]KDO17034.1 hypothetical protein SPRG_17429 [Saprolegnia parasitica CBS 223.65]|eukprot:XP_012212261.1 hypothetical protein SPRG_17429 [Saprolegnia parasitica CBS 223.65]
MGHDLSKQANRLSIAAVSHITQFDRDDLLELRTCFENAILAKSPKSKKPIPLSAYAAAKDRVEPNLTRADFNAGLDHVNFFESDRAILDRLFTMLDKTGDDVIHYQEFLVGVAPLVKGNLLSKIALAFEMYDEDSTGEINAKGFRFLLTTISTVGSYFGDPVLSKKGIIVLTNDIFDNYDTIEYTKNIPRIAQHAIIEAYVAQEGAL